MKIKNLKKIIFAALLLPVTILAVSCADPDGLHNQRALLVTFEFTGMGDDVSGSYSIPGDFNSWNNSNAVVTLEKGEGTSSKIAITSANIVFSLVPAGTWDRPWYKAGVLEGNGMDGSANKYQNFYFDGLDMSAGEVTLVIDGSTGTAAPAVK